MKSTKYFFLKLAEFAIGTIGAIIAAPGLLLLALASAIQDDAEKLR